ncbi:CRISPR-associated RAMP family protein [Dulcicalothrix desertica PCC 7102]|uniref:CRISPR-associated RAMP family protein n=1 Tax=Dulcicalothrix desertica PCC 7102 TaxID=232991 RepID=A0A433V855_9CYAN|nr:TIGR03986 family CRISPR-associated RAMP protein [Dulcicalothrix desertica]RUT02264.1 CRISPR-associated RAMP family protein [Dulcicalothrix desertica PCC 7102]TWH53902.1 CRISPR-associated protein (TIGR03986 family) [Dulcicalothrix desertica PCC 7102]
MIPRHIKEVSPQRKAVAPYNFVELHNKVVPAELEADGNLRTHDRYYSDRYTGKIVCTLKTESLLYTRCGLNKDDFANFGDKGNEELTSEEREKYAQFFQHPGNENPVLAGSSLRGMFRNIVEIISFSKIERVSEQDKFFFRAVAAESDDPLGNIYKDTIKNSVKAGYLEKRGDKWFIRPATEHNNKSFLKIKEQDINKTDVPSLIIMEKDEYLPQYIKINVNLNGKNITISEGEIIGGRQGYLVTSGNMLETLNVTEAERRRLLRRKDTRKNHYIVLEPSKAASLEISESAIRDYCNALTDFQQGKLFENNPRNKFSKSIGFLEPGRPVFYCTPKDSNSVVTLFGQSQNFRIPYLSKNTGRAASAVDFVPERVGKSDIIDITDAIFGSVRDKKVQEQSRAGRVFFSDALYKGDEDGIWLSNDIITPRILASPKPTTFQHYLVQKDSNKESLKHYASEPNVDTVIRGHKLYWHKGDVRIERIRENLPEKEIENKQSQYTKIKPIKSGVTFEFTINFENLTDVELGALLWTLTLTLPVKEEEMKTRQLLSLSAKERYCFSLGMGKPLGMGAVGIEKYELHLNERYRNEPKQRYTKLFDGDKWLVGDHPATHDECANCINRFEEYITSEISKLDYPEDYNVTETEKLKLKDIPRIKMLLLMLRWDKYPPVDIRTRYMEIERSVRESYLCNPVKAEDQTVNEYKCRLVLPSPFQVMDMEGLDNRIHVLPDESISLEQETNQVETALYNFTIGQILDATVTKIKGNDVTYEFLENRKKTTGEKKNVKTLQSGQAVKIQITALKEDGNIKNVKLYLG